MFLRCTFKFVSSSQQKQKQMAFQELLTASNVVIALATLLFTRLLYVLGIIRRKRVTKKCPGKCELYNKKIKTMIVMGSGRLFFK